MSLKFVLLLTISLEVIATSLSCQPPQNCENVTSRNNAQMIENVNCGPANKTCGAGKVCRGGICTEVNSDEGGGQLPSTDFPYKTERKVLTTSRPTRSHKHETTTKSSHSLISGNQEFVLALVGFSLIFINFCLVTFCLARMKRRRLRQQRLAASRVTQSSQTGDSWNDSDMIRNRGIENFALNGDLDAFASEFMFSPVHLPPYDFSSAYHKPRPRFEDVEEDGAERESSDALDSQSIPVNEDPPPYSDQQYKGSCKPPSYDEALTVLAMNVEESTSGL